MRILTIWKSNLEIYKLRETLINRTPIYHHPGYLHSCTQSTIVFTIVHFVQVLIGCLFPNKPKQFIRK